MITSIINLFSEIFIVINALKHLLSIVTEQVVTASPTAFLALHM